jgi:hypothetical protein
MDESLLSSQMQSLLYAIGLVVVVISILLKSIKKGLIATVPILVTLVILFGFMGFTGIPLDIATVLVGSISIGIGIDYSIHMIVHVNHELRNSLPMGEAIAHSVRISGRSITLNVLSVTAGFLVLMLSNLMPLQRFGLLVAVTMIASGLAALTLLPVLLVSTSRSKKDNK